MLSVEDIYDSLQRSDPELESIAYGLSHHNKIEKLLNTPNLWGHNPGVTDYIPAAGNLRAAFADLVASATSTVDITVLFPFPDGLFLEALQRGIARAVPAPGRTLQVRVTAGFYYPFPPFHRFPDPIALIEGFIAALDAPSHVKVIVAGMQTWATSWNHAKLIIVDGVRAISGGHNLWSLDYTQFAPVHDLSMQLAGPAVAVGERYINRIWNRMWHPDEAETAPVGASEAMPLFWSRTRYQGTTAPSERVNFNNGHDLRPGATKILSLARMGFNLETLYPISAADNASHTAMVAAIKMSDRHVRMSQQMLGGSPIGEYDPELFATLCAHILAGKKLSLIISDTGAATQDPNVSYSGDGVLATAKRFAETIRTMQPMSKDQLVALLSAGLHIGPLRVDDRQHNELRANWKWSHNSEVREPANHAKVIIFDEDGYYFGSDNAYAMPFNPLGMQEFGFLVAGRQETQAFIEKYWEMGWRYSIQFEFDGWQDIIPEEAEPQPALALVRPT